MKRFTKIMTLLAAMTVAFAFAGCENFIMGDSTDIEKENPDYTENEKKSDGDSENSDKGGGDSGTTEGEHSDPNDTDNDVFVVTGSEWECWSDEDTTYDRLIFYSDKNFMLKSSYYGEDEGEEELHGTYSCNTSNDGTISVNMEDDEGGKKMEGIISKDRYTMKFRWSLNSEEPFTFTRVK